MGLAFWFSVMIGWCIIGASVRWRLSSCRLMEGVNKLRLRGCICLERPDYPRRFWRGFTSCRWRGNSKRRWAVDQSLVKVKANVNHLPISFALRLSMKLRLIAHDKRFGIWIYSKILVLVELSDLWFAAFSRFGKVSLRWLEGGIPIRETCFLRLRWLQGLWVGWKYHQSLSSLVKEHCHHRYVRLENCWRS